MIENRILQLFTNNSLKDAVCRLCLRDSENLFNIYESSDKNCKPLSEMLELLISIKLTHENRYPEAVCKDCMDIVIAVSKFKLKCEESNTVLKKCYEIFQKNERIVNGRNIQHEDNRNTDSLIPLDFEISHEEVVTDKCIEDCYECKYCKRSFLTSHNLHKHVTESGHELVCKICKKECRTKKRLKGHYESHKKKKELICPYCEGFVKKSVHSDEFKYICGYCEFKYPCKYYLEKHITSEHSDGIVCKKTDDNTKLENLKNNMENRCNDCNRIFKSSRFLDLHITAKNCKYICDYCGIVYKCKEPLKLHIMTKHINYKPYRCQVCQKDFALKNILKTHSIVHTKERKYQCDFCGKIFVCNMTLRYHRRLHTGERPYKCKICDEGFVNMSRLRDHEQRNHIGKVQCPICLSTFSKRSSLKQHMDKLHPNTYDKGQNYVISEGNDR